MATVLAPADITFPRLAIAYALGYELARGHIDYKIKAGVALQEMRELAVAKDDEWIQAVARGYQARLLGR